jgi:hypothetical protein
VSFPSKAPVQPLKRCSPCPIVLKIIQLTEGMSTMSRPAPLDECDEYDHGDLVLLCKVGESVL